MVGPAKFKLLTFTPETTVSIPAGKRWDAVNVGFF